jgi:hypothetical protein
MPLTATAARNAKSGKKPKRLYDSGGLYLEISPTGGRWWRFAYRFAGKRKLLSLGVSKDVPLATARKRRDEARTLLADGVDPSAARQAAKNEAVGRVTNSFDAVAREWYTKQAHTWVPSHATDVLRRLESNLFPVIGATPVAELTAPACSRHCARSSIAVRMIWRTGFCRWRAKCCATTALMAKRLEVLNALVPRPRWWCCS